MITAATNKTSTPPIQNLYFKSVFMAPPPVTPYPGIEALCFRLGRDWIG
jgi:hypothetical protein